MQIVVELRLEPCGHLAVLPDPQPVAALVPARIRLSVYAYFRLLLLLLLLSHAVLPVARARREGILGRRRVSRESFGSKELHS